ncbi:aldo/keto reductase [Rhizobium sp. BK376]|uniref:aldo/keto reductase n=1 Tax=Rhizobium sp. BK376 TaxID=2512149 RepID=UPI001046233D|nr:aldo/keto reductase [Rhizobium sp. BK376]TCR72252.1 aldo/keto reductase family protein [Rhizobium sp. BK376]
MNELRDSGVIKGWGIGVNEVAICLDILERTHLDCILIAGRYTLLDRRAEEKLLPLCAERGTSLVAGGVFNSGILATGPAPGAYFDYVEASADIRDRVGKIQSLVNGAGVDLPAVAMRFPLQSPVVASVLIGAATPSIVERNVVSLAHPINASLYSACAPFALR